MLEITKSHKHILELTPPDHELYGIMCDPNY
jgi:hypothetical protein